MTRHRRFAKYIAAGIAVLCATLVCGYAAWRPIIAGLLPSDQQPFPLHKTWSQALDSEIAGLALDAPDHLVLARTSHALWGLDTADGKPLWRLQIGSQLTGFPPVTAGGRVFVADTENLWAFDAKSGSTLWRQATQNRSSWVTDASEDMVLVNSVSEDLIAYEAATGRPLWSIPVGRGYVRGYVAGAGVYVMDDGVRALDLASGRTVWEQNYRTSEGSVSGPPVIYFVTDRSQDDLKVVALDTSRNVELWNGTFPAHGAERLSLQGNLLFVMNIDEVAAVAADTGRLLWLQDLADPSQPTVLNGQVYVMQEALGLIQSLDVQSGQLTGVLRVSNPRFAYVVHDDFLSNGALLFSAQRNTIAAYSK